MIAEARQNASVVQRYGAASEVDKYIQRAADGFLMWEKRAATRYFGRRGRLLVVGCGAGREAFALAAMGHAVTAIDISEPLLRAARENESELGFSVDFRPCNGHTLEFQDETFDYVTIFSQVMGNVPGHKGRLHLLKEARRVLADFGVLVFSGHNRSVCEAMAYEQGVVLEGPRELGWPGDYMLVDRAGEPPCYWHYFTEDEIRKMCAETGFLVEQCVLAEEMGQKDWNTVWVCVSRKM